MTKLQASPEELVTAAYRILLRREPDSNGLAHFTARLKAGMGMDSVLASITSSEEYRAAERQGITPVHTDSGIQVFVDANEPEFGRAISRSRTWEPHIIKRIVENLRPGETFVDVGANVGIMSFHAAQAVGECGKVISFEPDTANKTRFLQGLLANGFENVLLYPFALSDQRAVLALAGSSNTYLVEPRNSDRLTQCVLGDDILESEERIDFIKIDIEGHEPAALRGLALTLRKHKPLVLCEFNPRCLQDHAGISADRFAGDLFAS